MRRLRALVLGPLLAVGGCATAPVQVPVNPEVQAEVLAFLDKWNTAMAARDRAAIRASYSSSEWFRWFEDGKLRYKSADEVMAALDQFPPGSKLQTRLSNVTTRAVSERLVQARADFQTRIVMPNGAFEFGGTLSLVLERTEKGLVFINGNTMTTRPAGGRQ